MNWSGFFHARKKRSAIGRGLLQKCFWLFMFFGCCAAFAQRPDWMITLRVPSGFELYLEDMWSVDIMNPEAEDTPVFLFGEVFEEQKGEMFRGRSNLITVQPGGRAITPRDVNKIVDRWFNPEFQSGIERTGRFPAGNYTLCITVIMATSGEEIGRHCIPFMVTMPSATRLIAPLDEGEITELYPIFQWSEPTPLPHDAAVFYRFKISEIYSGQTPAEAMDNIAHFEVMRQRMSTLQYPLEGLRFEQDKEYVWQVQALDEEGKPIGENDGKSEIWQFKYQAQILPIFVELLPPLPDTLVVGGFRLTVDKSSVSVKNQRLSGKASGQFLILPPCSAQSQQADTSGNIFGQITIPLTVYSAIDFTVEFSDIQVEHWPPQSSEKVIQGQVGHSFSRNPLELTLDDFIVSIKKLTLSGDSTYADLLVQVPVTALYTSSCSPVTFSLSQLAISKYGAFYYRNPAFTADSLLIGNTGIMIAVRGLTLEFRKTNKYVEFDNGETIAVKLKGPSNTGYLQGEYSFSPADVIGCEGFKADLKLKGPWEYNTLLPLNFAMSLQSGELSIEKNWIKSGKYAGHVSLSKIVLTSESKTAKSSFSEATVDSLLNMSGAVVFADEDTLQWGGFQLKADSAQLYLPGLAEAFSVQPLDTLAVDSYESPPSSDTIDNIRNLPGITFALGLHGLTKADSGRVFSFLSPDCKASTVFPLHPIGTKFIRIRGWLNIAERGVTGELKSYGMELPVPLRFGVTDSAGYKATKPFSAYLYHKPDSLWLDFMFVRNAVYESCLAGTLDIPYPCGITPNFKKMKVTSTAELVGGDVFCTAKELKYWGVKLTAEKTGNVISADLGEIVFMNSKVSETVHFAKPFRIIWGEMLADGSMGKFLFDYNSSGQRFDGFPLTLHAAALSKYHSKSKGSSLDTLGYLRAYGDLHFDFFGAKRMDIHDYKDSTTSHDVAPFNTRFVALNQANCNLHFDKKWGAGRGRMVFDVVYDNNLKTGDQNGYLGDKNRSSKLDLDFGLKLLSGVQTLTPDLIDLNSYTSYLYFCKSGALKLLDSENHVDNIGGIIQIKGDSLKRFYVEGQAAVKGWSYETNSLASVEITPNTITFQHRGQVTFNSFGVGLLGMASSKFVVNTSAGSLEGDISGAFRVYGGGTNFIELFQSGSYLDMEAKGRLNFYTSPNANYVQGYADISIVIGPYNPECEGAFFVGTNAPTDKIWVLDTITKGPSIKEKLSLNNATISGFYLAGLVGYTGDIGIASGGFQFWAGMGFFVGDKMVTFIGHGGIEVHGSLFGGLLKASAWAELFTKTAVGADKFIFCLQASVGFEVCAAIVFCFPVEMDFHIDGLEGIVPGSCEE